MTPLVLHVRSGARSGQVLEVRGDRATVGRSPEATLRFDPERDLEVSTVHAEIVRRGDAWVLRDLGSRNGTWVDGARVEGEHVLAPGQRIRFGADGPEVEVALGGGSPPPTVSQGAAERGAAPDSPSDRIRALSRRNRTLTWALAVGALLVAVGGTLVARAWTSRNAAFERERAALRSDMDSLIAVGRRTIDRLQGQMAGLAEVLRESEIEVRQLRADLDAAEDSGEDGAELDELRVRLQAATTALTRQQLAASLDFPAIEAANRSAVAVVYVEQEPGVVSTGTAFAVRADGTLLTNRHVVRGPDGDMVPRRIAVQFTDSPQVWPARVVTVAPEADLATLRVDRILGEVPTVAGFNTEADTLAAGAPVALIGFPLGGEGADEIEGESVPRALLSAGIVTHRSPGRLDVQGYGDQGASGSPVFDAEGLVVGVLYGGRDEGGTRILTAVPAAEVLRFLGGR